MAQIIQKAIILFVVLILVSTTALSFSGLGSCTEEYPYQITNVHQLQEMNDNISAHYYILMNDIDAIETKTWNIGDHDGNPNTQDSAMGFEPIHFYSSNNEQIFVYYTDVKF